jgi:hypothetical protein
MAALGTREGELVMLIERVGNLLQSSEGPVCDRCLSEVAIIRDEDTARLLTLALASEGRLRRTCGICTLCEQQGEGSMWAANSAVVATLQSRVAERIPTSPATVSKAGNGEASLVQGLIFETLDLHSKAIATALKRLLELENTVREMNQPATRAVEAAPAAPVPERDPCSMEQGRRPAILESRVELAPRPQLSENTTCSGPTAIQGPAMNCSGPTSEWWRGKAKQVRAVVPGSLQLSDCHFYHSMTFPDGSEVQGDWDIRECFSDYLGNIEVCGKTLLDVGTASGIVAFEAERRGARVTAYETPSLANVPHIPFRSNLFYTDHPAWVKLADTGGHARLINSFWYAHHRFKSNVQVVYGDLFELADMVPPMDIVVAGAILEHISDPIRAIEIFSKIAKETIVLASTPVVETEDLILKSITKMDDPRFDYTWFAPSTGLLRRVFQNVGFRIVKIGTSRQYARFKNDWAVRPTVVAERL